MYIYEHKYMYIIYIYKYLYVMYMHMYLQNLYISTYIYIYIYVCPACWRQPSGWPTVQRRVGQPAGWLAG